MKFKKNYKLYQDLANCIRVLAADAVEKANSGHPGMPLGFADIMTVLAFNFLRFNPNEPKWFDRDRLILSNGHGSMLLYAFYYVSGYKDFTLDDIKNFRTLNAKTPGHPEYGAYEAIETTTGPLGQGFGNAVGMAIAAKKYKQKYKIYCIVGDGCLMEGVSYEAASLAGHLALNNLVILFDNNNITIDGAVNLSCSEDQIMKFKAFGWETYEIDGHNIEEIYEGLKKAQNSDKPVFISCRTIIAKSARIKEGSEKSHGAPLGKEVIKRLKEDIHFPLEDFAIPQGLLEIWRSVWGKSQDLPLQASVFGNPKHNNKVDCCVDHIGTPSHDKCTSTRSSAGKIIAELLANNNNIICGSADLSISNNIKSDAAKPITKDDFSGNFIHYGIREHAMGAIMNGLALSGLLPIGGTFLIFSDYMKPAIRLAALMKLKIIYIFTHDSIGVGEDGPTHQPVEQLTSLRSIPNLLVMRPACYVETYKCFEVALSYDGPVAFALTRQNLSCSPRLSCSEDESQIKQGGYILNDAIDPVVTIFASGSEVCIALEVAKILKDVVLRVISVPCLDILLAQSESYIKSIAGNPRLKVAIEAGCSFGWHKIIGDKGVFFGVEDFGISAPYQEVYKNFELEAVTIAKKIANLLPL